MLNHLLEEVSFVKFASLFAFSLFTSTFVKRLGIAFFLHSHFLDSLKVFEFLVTLLNIYGKEVIFSKFSDLR